MKRRFRRTRPAKEQGFTLVEILVVVIIIGIIAAIAIPIYLNHRKKGVDASMIGAAKLAATAAESYSTDNPTSTTAITSTNLAAHGYVSTSSAGNSVSVTGSPNAGYRVCVSNPGSSVGLGATSFVVYNSNTGGLRNGFGACV